MKNTLFIIVPCYNEEDCLRDSASLLLEKLRELIELGKASQKSRIVFVDDGSSDKTWSIIEELNTESPLYIGIKLAANAGHQNAVMAGLLYSRGRADMTVSIDADLQDDPEAIEVMADRFFEGYDIVYGVRTNRESDSFIKRFTAESFYKIIKILGGRIVFNHADYRLMSSRAVAELSKFTERGLFLRGLMPMLGLKTCEVGYVRAERKKGESKYTPMKMLKLASDGITSLTTKPLLIVLGTGIALSLVSLISSVILLIAMAAGLKNGAFWLLFSSVWLIGGLLLSAIGLVGEYVGKTLTETKARPRFFVEKVLDENFPSGESLS